MFKAIDGTEFPTADECKKYEDRLKLIVDALIEPGLVESRPGNWISAEMNVSREFLYHIKLFSDSDDFLNRSDCAKHLAAHLDDYLCLSDWLRRVMEHDFDGEDDSNQ